MKRMSKPRPSRSRAMIYACALVALLVYGIPRIPSLKPGLAGSFSMLWILFAGLALAANVYFFVGADRERSRMLEELDVTKRNEEPASDKARTVTRRSR